MGFAAAVSYTVSLTLSHYCLCHAEQFINYGLVQTFTYAAFY